MKTCQAHVGKRLRHPRPALPAADKAAWQREGQVLPDAQVRKQNKDG